MRKKKDINYYLGKRYDGMMGRCYRPTDGSFKTYGAKGIKVCSDWISDMENFKLWFKSQLFEQGISEEYFLSNTRKIELDRKDPYGHYTPKNCRLVTKQTNARNKRGVKKTVQSAEGDFFPFFAA